MQETGRTITPAQPARPSGFPPRYRPVWIGLDYLDRAEFCTRRIDLRVEI